MHSHDSAALIIFLFIFILISIIGFNTNHRIELSNFEQAVEQCSENDGIKHTDLDLQLLGRDDFIVKCNNGAEFIQVINYSMFQSPNKANKE